MIQDLLPEVVIGVVAGSLYGLAASGLVLTYKTSGVFNFSHGALGAATAFLFHELRDLRGLPAPLAVVLAVGVFAPVLGLLLSRLAAQLTGASTVRRVVATVGVLLVVQGVLELRYGAVPVPMSSSFPTSTFRLFGVHIGYDQLVTTGISLAGVLFLATLFRFTRLGLRMRAVVDNGDLLALTGSSPAVVHGAAWVVGAVFAGLSGVLLAPTVGLDALLLTLVVIQAIGAAAMGRFHSTTQAYVGGVAVGVAGALLGAPAVADALPFLGGVANIDQSLPFVVLFAVLLLTRRGTFTEAAIRRAPRVEAARPVGLQAAMAAVGAVVVLLLPSLFDTKVPVLTLGAVFVVVFASLYLLLEVSGQVSLCHVAFVAVGATTFAHLTTGAGLPWPVGVAGAALAALALGALVAVPAIRLSGLFLALATFAFGILVERLLYPLGVMFGGGLGTRTGRRPALLGLDGDQGYFYLCAAVAAVALLTVVAIRKGQLGRLLDALADSPVALLTHGAGTNVTLVLVFCISAAMAGVGGALYVGVTGSAGPEGVSAVALISFNSLVWLVVLAISGRGTVAASIGAAAYLVVVPSFVTDPMVAQYFTLLFGAAAVFHAGFADRFGRWSAAAARAARHRALHSPVRARAEGALEAGRA